MEKQVSFFFLGMKIFIDNPEYKDPDITDSEAQNKQKAKRLQHTRQ